MLNKRSLLLRRQLVIRKKDERRGSQSWFDQDQSEVKLNPSSLTVTAGSHGSEVTVSEAVLALGFTVDIMSGPGPLQFCPGTDWDVLKGPVVVTNWTRRNANIKYQNWDLRLAEERNGIQSRRGKHNSHLCLEAFCRNTDVVIVFRSSWHPLPRVSLTFPFPLSLSVKPDLLPSGKMPRAAQTHGGELLPGCCFQETTPPLLGTIIIY